MASDIHSPSLGARNEVSSSLSPSAGTKPTPPSAAAAATSTKYKSACPRTADGQHAWTLDQERTEFYAVRYACECGATGWRRRALRGESHTQNQQIREYRPKSTHLKEARQRAADRADPGPKITAQPRKHGRNGTGGYLPPGRSGSWDR